MTVDGSPAALEKVKGVYNLTTDAGRVTFSVDDTAMPDVLKTLAGMDPRGLVSEPPSLEELFLRHYGVSDGVEAK